MLTWRIQGDNPRYLLKASLSEFISTLIFVFAGQGSGMAYSKLTGNGRSMPAGLVAAALAHGFGLMAAVSASWRVSGGHVNPAVTFGVLIQGRISILRGILYWVAQLFGSTIACLLLKLATHGMVTTAFSLSQGETVGNAFVLEMVMTFGLVYTVCATGVDHGKDFLETIGAVAIGFVVGANILVGGAFDGASMNPALAFGPALVSWTWLNHWVYWVGPLVGGGLAGFIYQFVLVGLKDSENPQSRS